MSTDLARLAADPNALELAADPGQFVILACERAKQWLTEALDNGDIDQLVELKSQAEAIRIYTAQKQIGKDSELAAAEIVRRAERGIGIAVKRGQTSDPPTIQPRHVTQRRPGDDRADGAIMASPSDYLKTHERTDAYEMAAASDDLFEEAFEEAKAEGNLTRSNVVRKVKGETTSPKSEWHRNRRNLDGNQIIRETVLTLDGVAAALRLLDQLDNLDDVVIEDWWMDSLNESVPKINKFRTMLKGITE